MKKQLGFAFVGILILFGMYLVILQDAQIDIVTEDNNEMVESMPIVNDTHIISSEQKNGKRVFYTFDWDSGISDKVTVYIDDGSGDDIALFDERAMSFGATRPEFQKLLNENIVHLTFATGDGGGGYINNHYIDTRDNSYISVTESIGTPRLDVKTTAGSYQINPAMSLECQTWTDEGLVTNYGQQIELIGVNVNGEVDKEFDKSIELQCEDPDGLGSGLAPDVLLKYKGISTDLRYVYFTLVVDNDIDFTFDLQDSTITNSSVTNMLK